jgi:hypothetical protein
MTNSPIFGPFSAMLMLTFIVWVHMYIVGRSYFVRQFSIFCRESFGTLVSRCGPKFL